MNGNNIGKIIKDIRTKNNYTQQQLADILAVTYQAVSKWENGKSIPDITILQEISTKFNIDIEVLLTGKKKNKNKFIVTIIFILVVIFTIVFIILKNNDGYEFKNIVSENQDFEIKGVIAFSDKKTSIFISDIKTKIEDQNKYELVECTLYEKKDNSNNLISECDESNENGTLDDLLKNITFNIDDFPRSCKNFSTNSLYLEINVLNNENNTINYKIPLILDKSCS